MTNVKKTFLTLAHSSYLLAKLIHKFFDLYENQKSRDS